MRGIIAEQEFVAATIRWAAASLKAAAMWGKKVPEKRNIFAQCS